MAQHDQGARAGLQPCEPAASTPHLDSALRPSLLEPVGRFCAQVSVPPSEGSTPQGRPPGTPQVPRVTVPESRNANLCESLGQPRATDTPDGSGTHDTVSQVDSDGADPGVLVFKSKLLERRGIHAEALALLTRGADDVEDRLVLAWLKLRAVQATLMIRARIPGGHAVVREALACAAVLKLPYRVQQFSQLLQQLD